MNLVFIADSCTGFCSELLLKTRVKHQKQSLELFCKKSCSQRCCKFHRKTPVLKSLFNIVTGLQEALLKRDLQPVEFAKFLRTPNSTTASETCSFTWTALFNNLHIWFKLIHKLSFLCHNFQFLLPILLQLVLLTSILVQSVRLQHKDDSQCEFKTIGFPSQIAVTKN